MLQSRAPACSRRVHQFGFHLCPRCCIHFVWPRGHRLDTEVGYGLPIGSRFVGTPRAGVRTSEYGRDYRIGYGVGVLEQGRLNLQIGVDAERRESSLFQMQEQGAGTDQRVLGRATVQW